MKALKAHFSSLGLCSLLLIAVVFDGLMMTSARAASIYTLYFSNTNRISILDNAAASPYPAGIEAANVPGSITAVRVTLHGFTHAYPSDVGVLVVGPNGAKAVLMNRAGGGRAVAGLALTFDAKATNTVPYASFPLASGSYRPADYRSSQTYNFAAPAPSGPYTNDLTVFQGANPNGTWKLFVLDDLSLDSGTINGGWSLELDTVGQDLHPPVILDLPASFRGFAESQNTVNLRVADQDGFVTNFTATIGNPALAEVSASLSETLAHAKVSIKGKPGQAGSSSVQVIATDNDGLSTTNSFTITLVDSAPVLQVSPPNHLFSYVEVGSLVDRTFVLTNAGGSTLSGNATVPPPFSIIAGGSYNLDPGDSRFLTVRYNPFESGTNIAQITFTGGGGATVPISGQAFLRMEVGSTSGPMLSSVVIPVRATVGFTNIGLFQFSMLWQAANLRFIGVEQFGLPGLSADNFGTTLVTNGILSVSWDHPEAGCHSLAPGTTLFSARFEVIGSPGTTNWVYVSQYPVAGEIANCQLKPGVIAGSAGSVFISPVLPISGRVTLHGTSRPVPGVAIHVGGSTNFVLQTAATGEYKAMVSSHAGYEITPAKTSDSPTANGVTSLDMALIRQHILKTVPLETPYEVLAADVDGSHSVATADIAWLRRFILGTTNSLPSGLWRFVRSDYWFPDALTPWQHAPAMRSYTNLATYMTNQDFVAIKLGDVNHSWTTAPAGAAMKTSAAPGQPIVVHFSPNEGAPGTPVRIGVEFDPAARLTSAQFTLRWAPELFHLLEVGELNLPGLSEANFGRAFASEGKLSFAWDAPQATGVTLDNRTKVFTLAFEACGQTDATPVLHLTDTPTPAEASIALQATALISNPGAVVIAPKINLGCGVAGKGQAVLSILTQAGVLYVIEGTDSLTAADWQEVCSLHGDGTLQTYTEQETSNGRQRFYRVRLR